MISAAVPSNELIGFFRVHPPVSGVGMMHYLNALVATGKTSTALPILKNWWMTASLTPNEQTEILRKFGQ